MHELAITQGVVDTVCERLPGQAVRRVVLRVGALVCLEPEAMAFCFDAASRGTPLEGALLEIVEVEAHASCRSCGIETLLDDPRLPLCACGSADLELLCGNELEVLAVEVA